MPTAKLTRPPRVVREEEVLDRVLAADRAPVPMRANPRIDACLMRRAPSTPLGLGENGRRLHVGKPSDVSSAGRPANSGTTDARTRPGPARELDSGWSQGSRSAGGRGESRAYCAVCA